MFYYFQCLIYFSLIIEDILNSHVRTQYMPYRRERGSTHSMLEHWYNQVMAFINLSGVDKNLNFTHMKSILKQ
jgi:hypothetical protein